MTADFKQAANLAGKLLASQQIQPQWSLSFTGTPTGGTFTMTVTNVNGSQTTSAINYSGLNQAAVRTALEGLSNVGAGNVTVTGSGPYTITFATPSATMSVTYALTGGTTPTAIATPGAVSATVYTVPASSAVKVATFIVHNPSTLLASVSISVVPSGGTVDGTHAVLTNFPLAAGDTAHVSQCEGDMWDTGVAVSVTSSTAPVNVKITGAVSS